MMAKAIAVVAAIAPFFTLAFMRNTPIMSAARCLPSKGNRPRQHLDVVVRIVPPEPEVSRKRQQRIRSKRIVRPVGLCIAFPGVVQLGLDFALPAQLSDGFLIERVRCNCIEPLEARRILREWALGWVAASSKVSATAK